MLNTPYYYVDETLLIQNLEILKSVKDQSGCKILLAQNAFSMFSMYPLISQYLDGSAASSLYEVKLGHEKFGGETHICSPALSEREFDEILQNCDQIIFNTPAKRKKYGQRASKANKRCGLRSKPEFTTKNPEQGI